MRAIGRRAVLAGAAAWLAAPALRLEAASAPSVEAILAGSGLGSLTGFALAFARGAGEYGSVIFLAGNVPMLSEIAPLLIVGRLEAYDDSGAAAVGLAMLAVSLAALLLLALAQRGLGRGRA